MQVRLNFTKLALQITDSETFIKCIQMNCYTI
jgi:hypothetical protein